MASVKRSKYTSIYMSRGGREIACSPAEFKQKNDYPYGKWVCGDGSEILYNRFYEAIWERHPLPDGGGWSKPEPSFADRPNPPKDVVWAYREDTAQQLTVRQKRVLGAAMLLEWGIGDPWPSNIAALKWALQKREIKARDAFQNRWDLAQLKEVAPDLHADIDAQEDMMISAILWGGLHECEMHVEAMIRGWGAAVAVMTCDNVVYLRPGADDA